MDPQSFDSTNCAYSRHASLVMFYSKNCQLCKSMTPMVNDMARKESWWLDVCYVDVDNQNWMPEVRHGGSRPGQMRFLNEGKCFMFGTVQISLSWGLRFDAQEKRAHHVRFF